MVLLSFQNEYYVDLSGSGSVADELFEYYEELVINDETVETDLSVKIKDFDCNPNHVLGKPTDYFGRDGDWFLRVDKHKKVRIARDWSKINVSPQVPKHWIYKLLEYRVRSELAEQEQTLVHASGAQVNDTTIAFPAWRHTGKTNTLMTLIQKHDANYLSDDRLWIERGGSAYGFPLPINLQPYNYNAFSNIEPPTRLYDRRYRLANQIRSVTSDTGSFFSQALYFLNEFYITPPSQNARIEETHVGTEYVEESPLDIVVCLQTVSEGDETIELIELSTERAAQYLKSISHREWNGMIRDYVSAFDLLFTGEAATEELQQLEEKEYEIWIDLLDRVETYVLTIPREEQWKQEEISRQILQELAPIIE